MTWSRPRFTIWSSASALAAVRMTDDRGRVRLRSNVVTDGQAWLLVPGELVAVHRPDLLRRENRPSQLQLDERMYYAPCAVCGRRIDVIKREGCEQCSHGPTERQQKEAQALHKRSLEAVTAARLVLTETQAAVKEAPAELPVCIVPGCGAPGVRSLNVLCRFWNDEPDSQRRGDGELATPSAPDADAPLCEAHALAGARITILFEPDGSQQKTIWITGSLRSEDSPDGDQAPDMAPQGVGRGRSTQHEHGDGSGDSWR